jgi:hypothetical protein
MNRLICFILGHDWITTYQGSEGQSRWCPRCDKVEHDYEWRGFDQMSAEGCVKAVLSCGLWKKK